MVISFEKLNLPTIPKRSRLYHLDPLKIGTPYVEGLISYICRLAEAHCVSPGILIKKEILPSFRKNYSISVGGAYALQENGNNVLVSYLPKLPSRKNLNEYGLLAWQYLEGLKPITMREDLEALVIPLEASKILPRIVDSDLTRDLRAWCPECFQAWRTINHLIYEPLLWSIAAITICPEHHKLLQSRCPHCNKSQRPLTARMRVAHCSQCIGWLGVRLGPASEKELATATDLEGHLEIAKHVMEILSL
ncbi:MULTISPECIES: TniQ family protein [Trichocoleus]|uniref:TniQ family protein n=1 Tax=Trichocoleus desertorum GB2-A4 TaxID=2933944 RepID=A0ABV0JC48_9CYAN|nr:TniQ family protein [Trichocoleus sp. FACHB-46]MBD1863999.1 TniQ family protein [Trichocoleus sp. FACHB-46]